MFLYQPFEWRSLRGVLLGDWLSPCAQLKASLVTESLWDYMEQDDLPEEFICELLSNRSRTA